MLDLFAPPKPKSELLKEWILSRNFTKTHDVIKWGLDNHFNRALRTAQELCASGEFRRMRPDEKKFFFSGCSEDVWVANNFI